MCDTQKVERLLSRKSGNAIGRETGVVRKEIDDGTEFDRDAEGAKKEQYTLYYVQYLNKLICTVYIY